MVVEESKTYRQESLVHATRARWGRSIVQSMDEACRAVKEIVQAIRANGFEDKDVFAVRLALEEAIVNAIKHGNKQDPEKQVIVKYRLHAGNPHPHSQVIEMVVEDQGDGFDPSKVPDPTAPEYLERPNGRGLMLMRTYMTSVEFNRRGNRVTMRRDCSSS